ncbi:hypothetical protein N480_14060 [Pseudoalteromonas luteoviolacea S2607]|nr:hypothetical protein N480_14060 [Pseudoalteromonas luteoviolacea S2607]
MHQIASLKEISWDRHTFLSELFLVFKPLQLAGFFYVWSRFARLQKYLSVTIPALVQLISTIMPPQDSPLEFGLLMHHEAIHNYHYLRRHLS